MDSPLNRVRRGVTVKSFYKDIPFEFLKNTIFKHYFPTGTSARTESGKTYPVQEVHGSCNML